MGRSERAGLVIVSSSACVVGEVVPLGRKLIQEEICSWNIWRLQRHSACAEATVCWEASACPTWKMFNPARRLRFLHQIPSLPLRSSSPKEWSHVGGCSLIECLMRDQTRDFPTTNSCFTRATQTSSGVFWHTLGERDLDFIPLSLLAFCRKWWAQSLLFLVKEGINNL